MKQNEPNPRPSILALSRERGRFHSGRKIEAVLRVLRGEDSEDVARELGISLQRLNEWEQIFLQAGQWGLQQGDADPIRLEAARLQQVIGQLTVKLNAHRQLLKLRCIQPPAAELPSLPTSATSHVQKAG